jgi:hypothetical protein
MVRGKHKNLTNRNQDYIASSEPSTPTTVSPGYTNTPETKDSDLKSYLMMMVEDFKNGINNSKKCRIFCLNTAEGAKGPRGLFMPQDP